MHYRSKARRGFKKLFVLSTALRQEQLWTVPYKVCSTRSYKPLIPREAVETANVLRRGQKAF